MSDTYTDFYGNVFVKSFMDLRDYPIGTKAMSLGGGCWTRVKNGWQWGSNGGVFPSVGGDWSGKVCLPENNKST